MLYLNLDNSLHDCVDIETGDVIDSDIVQDYKKLSLKLSQPGSKVMQLVLLVSRMLTGLLYCRIDEEAPRNSRPVRVIPFTGELPFFKKAY